MRRSQAPSPGFTLVELLVTIVIAAILTGLLLPVLANARRTAQTAACLAHQASNAKMALLYGYEHHGALPPLFQTNSPGESGNIKVNIVPRTARQAGIAMSDEPDFICPSDQTRGTAPLKNAKGRLIFMTISYGYNVGLLASGTTFTDIKQASDRVLFFDGSMSGPGQGRNVEGVYPDAFAFFKKAVVKRHSGKTNVAFADMHAATVSKVRKSQLDGP